MSMQPYLGIELSYICCVEIVQVWRQEAEINAPLDEL